MTHQPAVAPNPSFAIVPEWLLDADVSAQAIRLYAVLRCYADERGRAYPSRALLARRLHVESKRTVDRALKELVDVGAVAVNARADKAGDQTSNEYVVRRSAPGTPAPEVAPPKSPGGVTDAATPGHECHHGGRTDVATVVSQIAHELDPLELDPLEPEKNTPGAEPSTALVVVASGAEVIKDVRQDVNELCERLADHIEANGSKRPNITKSWRDACRLMIDRDGHSPEEIAAAIDWSQKHVFWHTNVLSMPTLRKQFDRMRLQATADRTRPQRQTRQQETDGIFERAAHRMGVTLT